MFEIELIVPWFGAAWGGLFFAPHVLSLAFPALLLPIRTDNLRYGIAHPDMSLSLELLRRYDHDTLVVSFTPDNPCCFDEVGIIGETTWSASDVASVGALWPWRTCWASDRMASPTLLRAGSRPCRRASP